VLTEYLALTAASSALCLACVWANFPLLVVLAVVVGPWIPVLSVFLKQRKEKQPPQFLWLHPRRQWKISDLEQKNSLTVELLQQWRHFFGLTLSLKILNCPHNKQETVKITVWRCKIAPETYRQMCVMAAWRLDYPQVEQTMETV